MVFSRKRSSGCETCVKRKIKCDDTMPRCSKCASAGWLCPGYLNPLDFLIRDQTFEVINKSCDLKLRKAIKDKATSLAKEPLSVVTRSFPESESLSLRRDLLLPVSKSAIDFFMVNYVSQGTCNTEFASLGSLDYLPALYSDASKDSMLYTIISALGLVGLSNISTNAGLLVPARRLYAKAMRLCNAALSDPSEATSDSTLATVMLLVLFESSDCEGRTSIKAWGEHLHGAAKLIEFRGAEQFRTKNAFSLLRHLRCLLLVRCVQTRSEAPYQLHKWSQWAASFQAMNLSHENMIVDLGEDLVSLLAAIKSGNIPNSGIKVARLLEIDSKLKFWLYSLPSEWMPQTFQISDDNESGSIGYASHYDVYPDPWIASLWGTYYSDRILIHEQLLGIYEETSSAPCCEARENFNNSVNVLQTMAEKICHSIPLCFRFLGYADISTGPLRKETGHHFIWAVHLAGMSRTTGPKQRVWIATHLRRIGIYSGSKQAVILSDTLLERKEEARPLATFCPSFW